jgi:hypothetical protein
MMMAHYAYRKSVYQSQGYSECPLGDPSMCENDCALCKMGKTGYNCAGTCSQCLLGGECDNTPAPDGSTRCTCVSDSLDSRSGCCPMGFSLLTGGDILARDGQVNGIKAGFVTYYERNRGEKFNGANAFYRPPLAPHDDEQLTAMGSAFKAQLAFGFSVHNEAGGSSDAPYALAGYENLKRDQFQAGCYPCPGMFTALSLCDRELEEGDLCSEEETEMTQERMWSFKTELSDEFKDDYNLWVLKKLPYQFQPQFFGFPFGYNGKPTYGIYAATGDFSVSATRISGLYGKDDTARALGVFPGTNSYGYDTIKEAQSECDKTPDCLYIVNIPPPPGASILWTEGRPVGDGSCTVDFKEETFSSGNTELEAKKWCYRVATDAGITGNNAPENDDNGSPCIDVVAAELGIEEIKVDGATVRRKPDAIAVSYEGNNRYKCWLKWNVDSTELVTKDSGARYLWWSTPWQTPASKNTNSAPGRFYAFAGYSNMVPDVQDRELWYTYYLTISTLDSSVVLQKTCGGESKVWKMDGKVDGSKSTIDYQGGTMATLQKTSTNTDIWRGLEPFFVGQTISEVLGVDKYTVFDTIICGEGDARYQIALLGLSDNEDNPDDQYGLLVEIEPKLKVAIPKFGHTVFTKVSTYKDSIAYVPEFSEKYTSGGAFSNACGGNQDYCQQVNMDAGGGLNKNVDATAVYQYRLGCTQCDVKNVYSIYSDKASVGDVYPIPGFDLGFSYSVGCAKCLPGQGGDNALKRIYEYCYPGGCNQITSDLTLFKRWEDLGVEYASSDIEQSSPLVYPTDSQKKCNGKLHEDCLALGDIPMAMDELSWRPGTGCSFCKAGTGFAFDLDNDGIIDDYQFNLDNSHDKLYITDDDVNPEECPQYVNTDRKAEMAGCKGYHVSNDVTNAYGAVVENEGITYQSGRGQMDPYQYYARSQAWPKRIFCRRCPVNTFSTDRTNCMNCPMGKTTQTEGSTNCGLCKKGQFFSMEKDIPITRESKCIDCPPGMYQDLENKISSESLVPDGWNDARFYETNYNDLPPFAKGYGGCKVCPPGKFNPFPRQTKCFDCPEGTYDPQLSKLGDLADIQGGDIPLGWSITSKRMPRVTMAETCATCPVGTYNDKTGQTRCRYCQEYWKIATKEVDNFALGCEDYESYGNYDDGTGELKMCNLHGTWGGNFGASTGITAGKYKGCKCTCESEEWTGNFCEIQNACKAPNQRYAQQDPTAKDFGSYCGVGGTGTPTNDGASCSCACENNVNSRSCSYQGGGSTNWCPGWDCGTEALKCYPGAYGAWGEYWCCLGGKWRSGTCPSCPSGYQYGTYYMGDSSTGRGDRCDILKVQGQEYAFPDQCCNAGNIASFSWGGFSYFFRRRRMLSAGNQLRYEHPAHMANMSNITDPFTNECIASMENNCMDRLKPYPNFNTTAKHVLEDCFWERRSEMDVSCPKPPTHRNQTNVRTNAGLLHMPKPYKPKHPNFLFRKGYRFEHQGNGTYKLHNSMHKILRLKTGGAMDDGEPNELQRSQIMGEDLAGTCMTETASYDGEGEGGVCTLIYETRGQANTAVGNTWDNQFDPVWDGGNVMYPPYNKFETTAHNIVYQETKRDSANAVPSFMMHNSPYDCQLNCPRGNYWDITNVPAFDQYNPGMVTGGSIMKPSRWTLEGVDTYTGGSWWNGDLGCTENADGTCGGPETDIDMIYEASIECPYYASILQESYCAKADDPMQSWSQTAPNAKFPFSWGRPMVNSATRIMDGTMREYYSKYQLRPSPGSFIADHINEVSPDRTIYDQAFATVFLNDDVLLKEVHDIQPVPSTCITCAPGRYNNIDAREGTAETACDPCPPGTFLPKTGQIFSTKCSVCRPGTFNDEWGQAKCKGCQPGKYAKAVSGVYTTTIGRPGYSYVQSVTSRPMAEEACASANMYLCSKEQVTSAGCMRIMGWTTDDHGYYCSQTRTVTEIVTDVSYVHRPYKYLGRWSTYSITPNADSCFAKAKNGNYKYFQLVPYWFEFICYLYPYEGTNGGQGGLLVYQLVSTQRVVTREETTTWVEATVPVIMLGIGAHCCSTGYVCTDCQIGKFNDEEGELECRFCENANWQDQLGTIACKTCPIGTEGTGMGKYAVSDCATCAGGHYNEVPGAHPCKGCPAGKELPAGASLSTRDNINDCATCGTGKYAPVGTPNCIDCQYGHYNSQTGQGQCTPCAKGYFAWNSGQTGCSPCGGGYYADNTGRRSCTACAAGKYNPNTASTTSSVCVGCASAKCSGVGASACAPATPGYYTTSTKTCGSCPSGQYQNQHGQTSCKNCPSGQYQNQLAQAGCKNCGGGKYQGSAGRTSCDKCPVAKYQNQGGQSSCKNCAYDYQQPTEGRTSCYKCPALHGSCPNKDWAWKNCHICVPPTFAMGSSCCGSSGNAVLGNIANDMCGVPPIEVCVPATYWPKIWVPEVCAWGLCLGCGCYTGGGQITAAACAGTARLC